MHHSTIVLHIPSPVISAGIEALINKNNKLSVNIISAGENDITDLVCRKRPSLLIADPICLGNTEITTLRSQCPAMKICALYSAPLPHSVSHKYDDTLSIYDNSETLYQIIARATSRDSEDDNDDRKELSPREKEVVVGIVKGLSNKEIANSMYVSVNTVMTHRRNIASKLKIHSPAGLTIYAIVSKLVSLDEVSGI